MFQNMYENSDSDQKSIFNHDQLIGRQKLIFLSDHKFSIIYDQSFYFLTVDFSTFFFWQFPPYMYG